MNAGVFDDMGRKVIMPQPVRRVVSLVPSDTESLCALGLAERIVGRTRYCEEPAELVAKIPVVGGTKDIDVDAVLALQPDLILANQEENSRANLEALVALGLRTFVSFPKRVADAIAHVARLARFFELADAARPFIKEGYALLSEPPREARRSVFVPIWRDPLMTFRGQTYCHDLLLLAGLRNVFSDRDRRYPLAADLGERSPLAADQVALRDRRYPRISEAELIERAPEIILLPSEPYDFGEADKAYFESLDVPAAKSGKVVFIDGKDLFWYGTRTPAAVARVRVIVDELTAG